MRDSAPRHSRRGWTSRAKAHVLPPAQKTLTAESYGELLEGLGEDGNACRRLDRAVDGLMTEVVSLSGLTAPLAVDYLDRLRRPLPSMTPTMGVQILGRAYVAHMAVEHDPALYRASDVPVVGTLPPSRDGHAPADLLNRVVKISRRSFEAVCALSPRMWEGFAYGLTVRVHQMPRDTEEPQRRWADEPVALAAVDGLARVGWLLRQVDIHYGTEPERVPTGS